MTRRIDPLKSEPMRLECGVKKSRRPVRVTDSCRSRLFGEGTRARVGDGDEVTTHTHVHIHSLKLDADSYTSERRDKPGPEDDFDEEVRWELA